MAVAIHARERSHNGLFVGIGLIVVAIYLWFLFHLMNTSTWDTWGAMLIGPVLFVAVLPALARQARREADQRVFWFLVVALAVKFGFSIARWYHAFYIVDGADARGYDMLGTQIALRFLHGNFHTGLHDLYDSNYIRFFTGLVYTVIRPSVVSGFLIYAWLAFWGTFFFYRAFVLAVPNGNRWSYARWLFFMPSILFWPSSIGKESWMMFGLGIAAFGAAKMISERLMPGFLISALGIGLAALVRAPIAVVFGAGLVVAGILRRPNRERLRELGAITRFATFALFTVVLIVLGATMKDYLTRSGVTGTSTNALVNYSLDATSSGGSEFHPTLITSPTSAALATVTVLYRPFIFETPHSVEGVVSTLEATILLGFSVLRFRSFLAAFRNVRRVPYVALVIVYIAGSIFALSPVANFGIIVRQRTLIYPMFLVLLCFSAARRGSARRGTAPTNAVARPPAEART